MLHVESIIRLVICLFKLQQSVAFLAFVVILYVWNLTLLVVLQILLDRKKRPYTLGFGGYGRLGHAEQKDEMIPRLIKFFDGNNRGVTQVYAGSAYTMAVNEIGRNFILRSFPW